MSIARRSGWWTAAMMMTAALVSGCSSEQPAAPAAPAPSAVPVSQPGLATVTGKAARGAVVALERSDAQPATPAPGPVVMDQRGQQFIPAMMLAQVGQPVEFRNGEGIPHNVYVTSNAGGAVQFNVSTDPGQAYTHVFDRVGTYEVACDIHPSMRATLTIVNSPHAAIVADFGTFTLMNVPPGAYELVTLYGNETSRRPVDVKGPHTEVGVSGS